MGVRVLAIASLLVLAGCARQVPYAGEPSYLAGLSRDQREQTFAETLSRAVKPRVYQVWIDDSSYGYDSARVARDGFGIPVGYYGSRRIVYFVNIGEVRMFTNNAVWVIDTSGRAVDKIVFANQADAARMVDVLAAYRDRRYRSEGTSTPRGRRYDRQYEERRRSEPPPEPRYREPEAPPPDYDDRGPYDMEGNRRDGYGQ